MSDLPIAVEIRIELIVMLVNANRAGMSKEDVCEELGTLFAHHALRLGLTPAQIGGMAHRLANLQIKHDQRMIKAIGHTGGVRRHWRGE